MSENPDNLVEYIHGLIADGKIWIDPKGDWHTRCPACRKVRRHRNRGLAIDAVSVLCRKCHIERHGNAWQQLKLLYQVRRQEDI